MVKKPLEQQIAEQEARLNRLKQRQKAEDRKRDTRRKIIAGSLALKHCETDAQFEQTLMKVIDRSLVKEQERSLFDLPPKRAENRASVPALQQDES